jgi:hypothetical protein
MNHQQMIDLTNTIRTFRPDWSHPGTVSQLSILNSTFGGRDADMTIHAIAIAADPAANTPGSLNTLQPRKVSRAQRSKEPKCYICGRFKSQCLRMRDWEIEHVKDKTVDGFPPPAPHEFESEEDAKFNSAVETQRRRLAMATLLDGKNLRNPDIA